MRRTALLRRTALRRGGTLNPVSQRRRLLSAERSVVRVNVFRRDRGCLLAALAGKDAAVYVNGRSVPVPACYGTLTLHHLRKSSAGGEYSEENGVCCCAGHNSWVECEPDAAHALGLVVRRGESLTEAGERRRFWGLIPQ